jgi:hypothetical protein
VFTELAGQSMVRGVMRTVSVISVDWVDAYFERIKEIDEDKIAGNAPPRLQG